MNTFSVTAILIFFDLPLLLMAALAVKKLKDQKARRLFLALAASLALWATPLVLVKADFLSQDIIAICSRLTFSGGAIAVFFLYWFCDSFGSQQGTKSRYAFGLNALFLLGAVLLGFVEQGVVPIANGFAPVHGPLHKYYVVSMSGTVLAAFFRLGMIFRGTDSSLLRFQIRSIATYGFFGFLFPIVNNGILPILVPGYAYPVFGVLGVVFFQFGIFRILLDGETLFIRRIFENVRSSTAWQTHENLISLSRFTNLLNSIFNDNVTAFKENFAFTNGSGQPVTVFAQSETAAGNYGSMTLFNEKIMPKWNEGLLDNLVKLESDNKRLGLYLLKAESILKEQWLSDAVNNLANSPALPIAADFSIVGYLRELNSHLESNEETFGVRITTQAPVMAKLMAKAIECARAEECILISGEVGSGRKTLALAIDFVRTRGHNLEQISCANLDINTLTRHVSQIEKAIQQGKPTQSILFADIDAVPVDFLYVFNTLLAKVGPKLRLYFTMNAAFYAALVDAPQLTFEALNRIKLDVPPLHKRTEDIAPLLAMSAERAARATRRDFTSLSKEFVADAMAYSWPGNLTELDHSVQRALLISKEPLLSRLHLDTSLSLRLPEGPFTPLESAERRVISEYLRKNNYNKNRTRIELDITVNTLNAKMEKYGIKIP